MTGAAGWEETTLGAEVDLLTGFPFKSERYTASDDSIRLLRGDNIVQGCLRWDGVKKLALSESADHDLYQLREGDVVLAMDRPWIEAGLKYAAISKFDLPCLLVQRTARLRGGPRLDIGFLRYLVGSREFTQHIHAITTGTAVPHISGMQIKDFAFALPPLAEQKAIAHLLGTLDDKIELNRRMNATLEAMARALFQIWFVDPVQNGLPKGWRYATIADLCDINAWTLNKGDMLESIEYVEISEVARGNIANIQVFRRGEEPSRARRRLRHGDTVLSTVRPERGSYFLCLHPSPNLVASTGFAVFTPTKAPWSFVHAALTQPELSEHLGQQADGGAYPAIRPEIVGKWDIPLPNKPEIVEQSHVLCAPLYERADHNRRESRTLATLRDALLPKLLSGELRTKDAEKLLPTQQKARTT